MFHSVLSKSKAKSRGRVFTEENSPKCIKECNSQNKYYLLFHFDKME